MCESGKPCYEGDGCRSRVNQLKRLIWVLMIWLCVLTLGLGASITFQIILHQGFEPKVALYEPMSSKEKMSLWSCYYFLFQDDSPASQLISYDCINQSTNDEREQILWWRKTNEDGKSSPIKIEGDGNYFLFLKVTLQSRKAGVLYTVTVKMTTEGSNEVPVTEGHINGTETTTGFMGITQNLLNNTMINVIFSPEGQVDVKDTYFGLIKFKV